jgi:SAM-dependent methyltransferase
MLQQLKRLYISTHDRAAEMNRQNILALVRSAADGKPKRILDLGCDDGSWTMELGRAIGMPDVYGIELVPEAARSAIERGVGVLIADLNRALPLSSHAFDLVHANQVIEHVSDIDLFVSEVRRLLRPGGVAVISTENGSSWHNVFAAALGWQTFSLSNVSGQVAGLGNPLAVHRRSPAFSPTWRHKTVMNYLGLKELFEVHGFDSVEVAGAGYYPLPASVGRIDVRHSAFLCVKATVNAD